MSEHEHPDVHAVLDNLKRPMPLRKKIALVIKNFFRKIIRLQSCCGHPGEPGC